MSPTWSRPGPTVSSTTAEPTWIAGSIERAADDERLVIGQRDDATKEGAEEHDGDEDQPDEAPSTTNRRIRKPLYGSGAMCTASLGEKAGPAAGPDGPYRRRLRPVSRGVPRGRSRGQRCAADGLRVVRGLLGPGT